MSKTKKEILNKKAFEISISRLSRELIENHNVFDQSVIIGVQPRGVFLANRLQVELQKLLKKDILAGAIDTTFYRDDFRRKEKPLLPSVTNLDFSIEDKRVILVDDVLFTGRTIRASMDALLAYGRPSSIDLLVLIDRRFSRSLPIQADHVGLYVDTLSTEKVEVIWDESENFEQVVLIKSDRE